MSNVVNKLWNMFNMNSAEDQEEDYDEVEDYDPELDEREDEEPRGLFGRKAPRLQSASNQVKMVVMQPNSFENAEEICDLLRERRSIIINLEYVNKDVARRIIDVVSGAVHALDGHMQKVSNSIFLIAPFNYDITTEMAREEIKNKLSVSWLKNNNTPNE